MVLQLRSSFVSTKLSFFPTLLLIFASLAVLASAESQDRLWKSTDGKRSFSAKFVSRVGDNVTLKRTKDGKDFTLSLDKLHKDDQDYLAENHPSGNDYPVGNAYDTLNFGDSRDVVLKKLRASSLVETKVNEELLGRTGLNGIFQTKIKFNQKPCYLFFDWKSDFLSEVTLRTHPIEHGYESALKKVWQEMLEAFSTVYGKPLSATPYPEEQQLVESPFFASHLWRINGQHSALLGTGKTDKGYVVWLRLTRERIDPVTSP